MTPSATVGTTMSTKGRQSNILSLAQLAAQGKVSIVGLGGAGELLWPSARRNQRSRFGGPPLAVYESDRRDESPFVGPLRVEPFETRSKGVGFRGRIRVDGHHGTAGAGVRRSSKRGGRARTNHAMRDGSGRSRPESGGGVTDPSRPQGSASTQGEEAQEAQQAQESLALADSG